MSYPQVLSSLGQSLPDAQINEYIREFDRDGDGQISFNEFLIMMWRLQSGPSEKEIVNEMFQVRGGTAAGTVPAAPKRSFPCRSAMQHQFGG